MSARGRVALRGSASAIVGVCRVSGTGSPPVRPPSTRVGPSTDAYFGEVAFPTDASPEDVPVAATERD
jgi:hypothetical protein